MRKWKPIQETNGLYSISNDGMVINTKTGRIMKSHDNGKGYEIIGLVGNKGRIYRSIHRLVAEAFIPNPDNLPQINHKDENKKNNNADNLEWCDQKYNNNYGARTEKQTASCGTSKEVSQFDKNMNLINTFKSQKDAGRKLGIDWRHIQRGCKGKAKTVKGYIFQYSVLDK